MAKRGVIGLAIVAVAAFAAPIVWLLHGHGQPKPQASSLPSVAPQPEAEPPSPSPGVKAGLDWGPFADSPAHAAYDQATRVGAKEALLLYYGLRHGPFDPNEFASFFTDFQRSDPAWVRARTAEDKQRQLQAAYEALKDRPLLVQNREIRVGAYDAGRGGFPIYRSPDPRDAAEGLTRTVVLWDLSASGLEDLRRINAAAATRNRRYTNLTMAIELENLDWREFAVGFLPWPRSDAARVAQEFGFGEPLSDPEAIRALPKDQQEYRTITGYFVARPRQTSARQVTMEGEPYRRKTVVMDASAMVLATPKGTVLGVYQAP